MLLCVFMFLPQFSEESDSMQVPSSLQCDKMQVLRKPTADIYIRSRLERSAGLRGRELQITQIKL